MYARVAIVITNYYENNILTFHIIVLWPSLKIYLRLYIRPANERLNIRIFFIKRLNISVDVSKNIEV